MQVRLWHRNISISVTGIMLYNKLCFYNRLLWNFCNFINELNDHVICNVKNPFYFQLKFLLSLLSSCVRIGERRRKKVEIVSSMSNTNTIDWETLAKSSKPRRTMGKFKMAVSTKSNEIYFRQHCTSGLTRHPRH